MKLRDLHIVFFILTFLVVIIAKPLSSVTGIGAVRILPVALLLLGFLRYAFFRKGFIYVGTVKIIATLSTFLIFIFIYTVSVVRHTLSESYIGTINESFQILLLVSFTYAWFNYQFKYSDNFEKTVNDIIYTVVIAASSFIILNVIFYILDIKGASDPVDMSYSVTASIFGLNLSRSSLFFTGHPNQFALVVGAVITCIIVMLQAFNLKKFRKRTLWVILPFCCFCLLILDSRNVLGSIFFSLIICYIIRKFSVLELSKTFVFIIPLLPILTLTVLGFVAESSFSNLLSRGSSSDIITGNGRMYIWLQCLNEIKSVELEHLVGYGQVGHIASGTYKLWGWIFPGKVAHNFFFQTFFDLGYVGVLLIMSLLYVSLDTAISLYKQGYHQMIVIISFVLYFILSGTFESCFGVYNRFYTFFFIIFVLAAIVIKNEHIKQKTQSSHLKIFA